MKSNFEFLKKDFPNLAALGELAEKYWFTDSNSCLLKLGMMGETIVNLMFQYDNIPYPKENNAANRITILYKEGYLEKEFSTILHGLRKKRNEAAHENYASVEEAKSFLEMTYSLCEWFMQTYGDYSYENQEFVMPPENSEQEVLDEKVEELLKERLKEQEMAWAASAKAMSQKERRRRGNRAAGLHEKSEAETRYLIDEQLRAVGWEADTQKLRYSKGIRPRKGRNLAIAEYPTDSAIKNCGYADYALFVGEKLVGIIEAKAGKNENILSVLDYQAKDYARTIRKKEEPYLVGGWGPYKIPFLFATNGRPYLEQYKQKSGIWFLDLRKPTNAPVALQGWISPDGIEELLQTEISEKNERLRDLSFEMLTDKDGLSLRPYQVRAVQAAENAVLAEKREILLAMATGTGKTRTMLAMIYRFLKTGRFRRILFLVDRTALGEQALDVFKEVKLEELLTLDKIYNIKGLEDSEIEKETRIHIATVQSMVRRILYHEGGRMPAVTDYDLLIVDEAHRGYILDKEMTDEEQLYQDQKDYQSKYRSVIDYFHAVKIGMTATPALQTTQIFGEPVFWYRYREAVLDGYLVDHNAPHVIETKLSREGIHYKPGDTVVEYDPITGEVSNAALLEDELDFGLEDFNCEVITENFNRTVLKEIARGLDPENPRESGKTLIFAANDAHADMIVSILKEIFAESEVNNEAVLKITGSVAGGDRQKILEAIRQFKNEEYPSVVVTVDLLTTGIDVPAINTLVFLRRVRSRILFEQMLGRATRLCPSIRKTHFEIYDAVGTYGALEAVSDMKPVVVNPKVTYLKLLEGLGELEEEEKVRYQVQQVVAKLQRQLPRMDKGTLEHFVDLADGLDPKSFIGTTGRKSPKDAKEFLLKYRELFAMLQEKKHNGGKKIVISEEEDELVSHTRGYGKRESRPEDYLEEFATFLRNNRNQIAALEIVCTRPRDLTRESLKSLVLALGREGFTRTQLNTAVSQVSNEEMTADMISLIRRFAIGSPLVGHEERIRRAAAKLRRAHDFTKAEENWIKRIEEYLLKESVLHERMFDEDLRFVNSGGYAKINKVFQNRLGEIVREFNEYLYEEA